MCQLARTKREAEIAHFDSDDDVADAVFPESEDDGGKRVRVFASFKLHRSAMQRDYQAQSTMVAITSGLPNVLAELALSIWNAMVPALARKAGKLVRRSHPQRIGKIPVERKIWKATHLSATPGTQDGIRTHTGAAEFRGAKEEQWQNGRKLLRVVELLTRKCLLLWIVGGDLARCMRRGDLKDGDDGVGE